MDRINALIQDIQDMADEGAIGIIELTMESVNKIIDLEAQIQQLSDKKQRLEVELESKTTVQDNHQEGD